MATQDDFAAAKYHALAAVYWGSIHKFKPRYTALRGGSIDSNLQLCGSSWTTGEEASFQSILTAQMEKSPSLSEGDRARKHSAPRAKFSFPKAISPQDGWGSNAASVHDLIREDGGELSDLSHQDLTQDPGERKVSSAALETIQLKDMLKTRRMSEGLLDSRRGLTDCSDPKVVTQKAAVCKSASQRLLGTSKPMPPTQNSLPSSVASRMSNGEQEHGESGTGCGDGDENNTELMSAGEGHEASLMPWYCSGEDGKKSLGVTLVRTVPKSARPSDGAPGSTALPVRSSQHLVFQEALDMRPRSGRRLEEQTLKSPELPNGEPLLPVLQHCTVAGVESARHLCEPVPPLKGLPHSQGKEMDHVVSSCLLSDDDDFKDSSGRIHVTLWKTAQKKIQQHQMRQTELLCREREKESEKEKSLQLPTLSVDPGDAAEEGFGSLPVNATVSISTSMINAHRNHAGTALRKQVNRPSLPSISTASQRGSFPHKSSASSLPAIALEYLEWDDEPESKDAQEGRPLPHPQQVLLHALTCLNNDDWRNKAKALFRIRRLAMCHSEVLLSRLHDVSLAVTKEVNHLRSKVSRCAINTLGELFRILKKDMDQEVDNVARVLLQKMGDSSNFIQKAANQSLATMVETVTPARAMSVLMAVGVQHRNALVRKCAAEHLLTTMEKIGANQLLSCTRGSSQLLVHTVMKLAQDCHPDTRCYGRKMLNMLMSQPKFDTYLKHSAPSRDLEDLKATLQQKGTQDPKCEPSIRQKKSKNSSLTMPQDKLPSGGRPRLLRRQTVQCPSLRTVGETDQLSELSNLLTAKDFQTRTKGVALLLGHCKNHPQLVSTNIVRIFDDFVPRLQDCHKKVKQQALEALALMIPMLRDALHPVLVPLVAAVTDNLKSKDLGIYAAAVKALEASISHLDDILLLQVFTQRVHYLNGKALLEVAEHLPALVASVYPLRPQVVKCYALPVLWFFLGKRALPVGSGNVRAVVIKLAKSLYEVMGSRLKENAASQPQHVVKNLNDILDQICE
ncbi:TOG array regulator of axonemal microtubules protein 2 [Opisthocomus hoazin]